MNTKEMLIKMSQENKMTDIYEFDGLKVRYKKPTVSEMEKVLKMVNNKVEDLASKQLIMFLLDEKGNKMFEATELEIVKELPVSIFKKLNGALNKLINSDVEEKEKN